MPSHAERLLEQARHLAQLDPGRPRQANLRRSISSAYYALFHLLVDDASRSIAGASRALRIAVSRAFEHGEMKEAASDYARGNMPNKFDPRTWTVPRRGGVQPRGGAQPRPTPQDLQDVAATFRDLQVARHSADYNMHARFTRRQVETLVDDVRLAFEAWERVRRSAEADEFRLALLLWRKIRT